MGNSICLVGAEMKETISEGRFATLENEVEHIKRDIDEVKSDTKSINGAVQSINLSLTKLAAIAEQNSKLEPRVKDLEDKVDKVNMKIAAASGGGAAIGMLLTYLGKIRGLWG